MPSPSPALPAAPLLERPAHLLATWRRADPAFFATGLLMLAAVAPLGAAALIDDRTFQGADIWIKPLKFAVALGLYSLTLALYALALPPGWAERRGYRLYRGAVIAAMWAELAWIAGAAAAGTASHFNGEGAWAVAYPAMGLVATLLTSASAAMAWGIARNPRTGLPRAVKEGLVLGLGLVLPLTLVTAGTLSAQDGHLVGAALGDAAGSRVPFLGWSREVGDLRVAHFLGTHAMHAVPLFAVLSAWAWGGARRAPVRAFAAAYVALTAFAFLQALAGRPFLP